MGKSLIVQTDQPVGSPRLPAGEPEVGQVWRNAQGRWEIVAVAVSGSMGQPIRGKVTALRLDNSVIWEGPTEDFLTSFEQEES